MEFQEALNKEFSFTGRQGRDNLPALACAKMHWGPAMDHGRHTLARMLRDMEVREGVEVGTHSGFSAELWARHCSTLHLTCVDPYAAYAVRPIQAEHDKIYASAVKRLKPYNVDIIRERSLDAVESFEDRSLDFVNIDGNHEFDWVVQDLIHWAPKVRDGGVVMLHDYCNFWRGGVVLAVNAYTTAHRVDPWYVTGRRDKTPTAFWERGAATL